MSHFINTLFKIISNGDLIPFIRGCWYAIQTGNSVKTAYIKSPLKFSYKHILWGKGLWIQKNCRIEAITEYEGVKYTPSIIFGNRVSFQQNAHVTCAERIEIGDNTAIASNVTITDIDHPYQDITIPIERQPLKVKSVKIGKDCKIYNNAVILQGTVIGNHCVVGANSVVKGEIPDYSIVVGCPSRIIKRYNFETNIWEPV